MDRPNAMLRDTNGSRTQNVQSRLDIQTLKKDIFKLDHSLPILVYFRSLQLFFTNNNNCSLQRDSNTDCRKKWRAR